jgi:hypothetical protein
LITAIALDITDPVRVAQSHELIYPPIQAFWDVAVKGKEEA